jgi:hypothetical protein
MSAMNLRIAAVGTFAAVAVLGAHATAQESPADIARRDLIAQAEAAAAEGDHARALQLGERAAQLRVTPTLHYFLAREHLALDHPVEALGYSGACARAAEADLALRNRDAVLAACRAIVVTTEGQVGRVTVRVPPDAPAGLTVRVRGETLAPTLYDVAYPVTPGTVVLEASAPGHAPMRHEVTVAARQTVAVDVRLDAAPAVVPTAAAVAPPVAAPPVTLTSRDRSVGPWIVAGGGAAVLVLGGVLYALAVGQREARDGTCVPGCQAEAEAHDGRYASYLTATNVAIGVGAAAVVGGAAWWILDRYGRREARGLALRGLVTPTSVGLAGRF